MHAGIPSETEGLPGSLWDNGVTPSNTATVHARNFPCERGMVMLSVAYFICLTALALHLVYWTAFSRCRMLYWLCPSKIVGISMFECKLISDWHAWFLLQIVELTVSEKDIEKEHLAQLRRWKETRGELNSKSPPRMHGAKAIMAADPPSRQELRQRPTIIVESPLAPQTGGVQAEETMGSRKTEEENGNTTVLLPQETFNPNPTSSDPSGLLKHTTIQGSTESLSSAEHDTYL